MVFGTTAIGYAAMPLLGSVRYYCDRLCCYELARRCLVLRSAMLVPGGAVICAMAKAAGLILSGRRAYHPTPS
eukprot:377694-Rhodomonas_salina.4